MQKNCKTCSRVLDQFGRKFPPKSPDGYYIPSLASDSLVFKKDEQSGDLMILLITRGHEPSIGKWAFPGGHVNYNEATDIAALRELKEECNLDGKNAKLFSVYGKPERDPRKHCISTIYEVQVDDLSTLKAGDDATGATFVKIKEAIDRPDNFAFDHHTILKDFVKANKYL